MTTLRLMGYWRNDEHPEYPDPSDMVDQSWDDQERHRVWWYVTGAMNHMAYMGLSPCRLCGKQNGAMELTDGTYAWPEGLGHYLYDHGVRLPEEFVRHALARLDALEDAATDLTWWLQATS